MPLHNKVGAVVALIAVGLLSSLVLVWPGRDVSWQGLAFVLSGKMLLGLVVIGLAGTGTDAIVRGHPKLQPEQLSRSFLHCILPMALAVVTWSLLARSQSLENRVIAVVASSGLMALLIAAEYYTVDPAARWRTELRLLLQLAAYGLAALLYMTVRLSIPVTHIAAIAVGISSGTLGLRLLSENEYPLWRIGLCALGLGVLLGAISTWPALQAASLVLYSLELVVFLYVLTGLARQFLAGKLRREVALEYLLIGLLALLLLFVYVR